MIKRIKEKAKDDRMSDHATFIAAKRQEIASLTAKIEAKLTWQDDPAVEAESMKNEVQDAELSCAEATEALASVRDLQKPRNSKPFTKQRSSVARSARIDGGSRAAKL